MLSRFRSRLSFQGSTSAMALLFNSLSWYFLGLIVVDKIANVFVDASFENMALGLAYPISIIIAGLIGATFFTKMHTTKFFSIWVFSGLFAALLPGIPLATSFPASIIFVLFIGSSLGIGMPLCLSYFATSVPSGKRGKSGGIVFLCTALIAPLVSLAITMTSLDLFSSVVVFASWRAWSLLILPFFHEDMHFETNNIRGKSLFSILGEKNFRLYFIAWLMFSLVDSFESVVLRPAILLIPIGIRLLEPLIAGISALAAGIFSDWIGRKRIMIFGFVSLGIAYAILGIAHDYTIGHIPGQIYTFFFIVDGVAIGLLWVLFTIVIWGDMPRFGREKYYAVGETPLFLTQVVSLLSAPLLTSFSETAPIFSLAAFFLFISVIPLLYARETLPMKNIQEHQLKTYTEEALKLKQRAGQRQT